METLDYTEIFFILNLPFHKIERNTFFATRNDATFRFLRSQKAALSKGSVTEIKE